MNAELKDGCSGPGVRKGTKNNITKWRKDRRCDHIEKQSLVDVVDEVETCVSNIIQTAPQAKQLLHSATRLSIMTMKMCTCVLYTTVLKDDITRK